MVVWYIYGVYIYIWLYGYIYGVYMVHIYGLYMVI